MGTRETNAAIKSLQRPQTKREINKPISEGIYLPNKSGRFDHIVNFIYGFNIRTGTNARAGTTQLTNGFATITTTEVKEDSLIFLTPQNRGNSSTGTVSVFDRTIGTSFDILSNYDLDDRNIAWLIINPA